MNSDCFFVIFQNDPLTQTVLAQFAPDALYQSVEDAEGIHLVQQAAGLHCTTVEDGVPGFLRLGIQDGESRRHLQVRGDRVVAIVEAESGKAPIGFGAKT